MRRTAAGAAQLFLISVFLSDDIQACTDCRPFVEKGLYNGSFLTNLFYMLLPLAIIILIGITVYFSDELKPKLKGIKLWQLRKMPGSDRL